ncbi:hypothetical protein EDD15DRAFT_1912252 [Pisolithus albus]|nr:hypothetical protein EDD15DRAFT_1912252 [Pisolithus albus]
MTRLRLHHQTSWVVVCLPPPRLGIDNTIMVATRCSPSISYSSAHSTNLLTGRWARWRIDNGGRLGARTSEDVSILNGKTTAKGEGEDEETITLEIDENDHLIVDDVVAPVAESFEENDDDDTDEDEFRPFSLSIIDFPPTRLVSDKDPTQASCLV